MTTIAPLPDPPSRADPLNFAARGDAFLAALPDFAEQANTLAAEVNTAAGSIVAAAETATTSATTATTKAGEASSSATAAANSAATALNAPGTIAASTTSLAVATGTKSLVIQSGKAIALGASVIIASTATPGTRMSGVVTAHDGSTGALTVDVTAVNGSGTHADWTVSLGSLGTGTLKTINGESLTGDGNIETRSATISGNLTLYATQSTVLTITNYDSATNYSVTATGGTASISGDQITYTAGATAGTFALNITAGSSLRAVAMTVQATSVVTPTITSPANGATNQPQAPTFTTSAFATIGVSDTHLNTDHEVRTGPNGTGTLAASSMADASNKTSWTMPGSLLATATTYYYRARHRGTTLGASGWGEISFTTAASFGGLIGTQGGQGFGVGVCTNGSLLVALGLAAMTGTTDPAHANYGNYQHSNGSIVCYVPKHFVRVGHAASPRYATYGANAHDVVGIETFANEAAANAAGYYMPRAFVNGGIELGGFFYDKYLASKDGTASCKSVFGGVPISLATTAGYTVSNGMTGCTGIYADAVVLAKARGAGWHCASVFQSAAVAILSLAHGQAATSTTHCAWYDAGGTTNFPKGCNNNALSDTNDGTVTWASAGDSGDANKPKTGATANFAKTTHNGQACGIADVNGAMWQVLLGITTPGTSGTDTTQATTGAAYQSAYVLKRSTDIAALTAGWTAGATGTDAWGDAAHLAALYDQVSDVFPWATSATTYFGNGSNQVFSGDTSGRDYHRTACGIPKDASATGATGTSQFGNDQNYAYNRANLFVHSAGGWGNAADAGVFHRNWGGGRSNSSNYVGFRAAACG